MAARLYRYFLSLCVFLFIIVLYYIVHYTKTQENEVKSYFNGFDNMSGVSELIVPNIVHFVIFGKDVLDFTAFLCILAVLKVQRPDQILIHTNVSQLSGRYWKALQSIKHPNTSVEVKQRSVPTHVFGQPLSSVYHASDITRIQVLMENGGIYLDTDTLVLRSLDRFRHFEMSVGWPNEDNIGTQILVANKNARFLKMWLNCYRRYHPREWYFNAGQLPTEMVLKQNPSLVHRVPYLFGVQNLAAKLYGTSRWPQWRRLFSVHLLQRHPPAPRDPNEDFVRRSRTPYAEIARWILYKLEPAVNLPPDPD